MAYESHTSNNWAKDDPFGILGDIDWNSVLVDDSPDIPANKGYVECPQCFGAMDKGMNNMHYSCSYCGCIVEGDTSAPDLDEVPREQIDTAQLRIVGTGSSKYQPDLYRSSSSPNNNQKKCVLEEYEKYRKIYVDAGGRAFPLDACSLATEYYTAVQKAFVKRSQIKKVIMAACLYQACLVLCMAPSKSECAELMQCPNRGIAKGLNFVRDMVSDGSMDMDVNINPCKPEITSIFASLGYEGPDFSSLKDAVYEIVQLSIAMNIGTRSVLRSKVSGATYVVIRRCADRTLIPKPISLVEFCEGRIRKNTIDRFINQLISYHSKYVECYKKYGLSHELHMGKK